MREEHTTKNDDEAAPTQFGLALILHSNVTFYFHYQQLSSDVWNMQHTESANICPPADATVSGL